MQLNELGKPCDVGLKSVTNLIFGEAKLFGCIGIPSKSVPVLILLPPDDGLLDLRGQFEIQKLVHLPQHIDCASVDVLIRRAFSWARFLFFLRMSEYTDDVYSDVRTMEQTMLTGSRCGQMIF